MLETSITIKNKLGLHTRAAAKLVDIASRFESLIEIQHNDQRANCKSIMALILLGLTRGVVIKLIITGADELDASDAITALINNLFEEME